VCTKPEKQIRGLLDENSTLRDEYRAQTERIFQELNGYLVGGTTAPGGISAFGQVTITGTAAL
jgi:hypothetical protein